MNKSQIDRLLKHRFCESVIEYAKGSPWEIHVSPPFIGCAGGIDGHTDEMFPPWSAFLVLRNEGCRIWQKGGYRGAPRAGERFTLNIHKMHGVRASGSQMLILVNADANTEYMAKRNLGRELRELLRV